MLLSGGAFAVALAGFYFSHVHRRSGAVLILLSRRFAAERRRLTDATDASGDNIWEAVSVQTRHLKYSLSNTGKQVLYVKSIDLMRGPNARGNLKSDVFFDVIPSQQVEPFLISPGEIKIIDICHATNYQFPEGYDLQINSYELVSLEVVSADGDRYQICHDISRLGGSGPDIHDPLWDGVTLGVPVRGTGFI